MQHLQPDVPIFYCQHEALDLRIMDDGCIMPLASLKDRRVLTFCGIGAPEHFRQTLQQLEAKIVSCVVFPDHHPFTRSDVEALAHRAMRSGAEILVTTEKDGVRLRTRRPLPMPLCELRIRVKIMAQENAWKSCILGTPKG
jgi:tetraacyldisaccharide 4'-kinase